MQINMMISFLSSFDICFNTQFVMLPFYCRRKMSKTIALKTDHQNQISWGAQTLSDCTGPTLRYYVPGTVLGYLFCCFANR